LLVADGSSAAEPSAAPDRGGRQRLRGSKSYRPPLLSGVLRPLLLEISLAPKRRGRMPLNRRAFLAHSTASSPVRALGKGRPLSCAEEAKANAPANPFLQGNFGPVREEITAENLKVIGRLHPEMDGMFVRNGPNPQFAPLGNYHLFEGDGMLH